ncbi:hypothetical protein ACFUGD_01690 [Streptomyces sp. NPDC057217]|uniref:hypothetical protein n=1 Tax=Streptomyces sp. NPDC057217 TaxID=3346054 RepID=UPI00363FD0D2
MLLVTRGVSDPLADRLDLLGDAVVDALEVVGSTGWSHSQTSDTLALIDALFSSLARQDGEVADILADARALVAAARWAVRDEPLPPPPRRGTNAARLETVLGAAQYRSWSNSRWLSSIDRPGT